MANERPRVLIFDDEEEWADQIAMVIQSRCDPNALTTIDHWEKAVSSSWWDVIVMDMQISEQGEETGTDHAERAILEYRIASPVIVVSGAWSLKDLQKRHPDIFFGYVSKDNLHDRLPELVDQACRVNSRTAHIVKMTRAFAEKFGILMKEFPLDLLQGTGLKQLFKSTGGKTLSDLICLIGGATLQQLDRAGKSVLMVIDEMRTK